MRQVPDPLDPTRRFRSAPLLALLPLLALGGCDSGAPSEGGPETRFLTSTPPPPAVKTKAKLLPLAPGAAWQMAQIGTSTGPESRIEAQVVTRSASNDYLIDFRRKGASWRREAYRETPSALLMTAMGEDSRPLMQLSPPVPLVRYPLREGDGVAWTGTFRFGDTTYPATGYSRISAIERVATPLGRVPAYRVDTLISIYQDGQMVKFPTMRWLAPGIGFVRRSFVDQGRPYYAELRKFTPG
ncbi:MAG: hypothetical protein H7Z41_19195 [Cytophagales bacterium]|nr:hypothetical protein [Armatimonadota bacterium]